MYSVIFKVTIDVWNFSHGRNKKYNTFDKYLRRRLKKYRRTNYVHSTGRSCLRYCMTFCLIKELTLDENDIKMYNKLVSSFKILVDNEYARIKKYSNNPTVSGDMCVYNKKWFNINKNKRKDIYDLYKENNNMMPDYNTILQYFCELKSYDPESRIMKSCFDRYDSIYEDIKIDKSITIYDSFNHGISYGYFGREEIINGFDPKYKVGDIVKYNDDRIAVIVDLPEASKGCGGNYIDTLYIIDFLSCDYQYMWSNREFKDDIRECDFKPYLGDIPEFMKLIRKAILKQDDYKITDQIRHDIDVLTDEYQDVVTYFDKFEDKLIELLTT